MKAVRYYGKEDLRVEDIAQPTPEKGGLLVKVEACAICGTDLKLYKGQYTAKVPVILALLCAASVCFHWSS